MNIRNIYNNPLVKVVHREINRMTSNWMYWFITLLGPLLSMWLVMNIFSQGVPRNLPIAVVDQDQTATSRDLTRSVDASSIAQVVFQLNDLQEAKSLMERDKIDAVVLIPKDAEKNIFRGEQANISVLLNNTNLLKGGMLQSGFVKVFKNISAHIKVGIKVKKGQSLYEAVGEVIPTKLNIHVLFNPYASYSYFLSTAILPMMLILFILLTTVYAFGTELRYATSKDFIETANNSIIVAILGKLIPYFVLFCLDATVMNYILFNHLETPLNGSFAIILISEYFLIATYQLIGIFFVAILANMRFALSIASAYSIMSITFSGLTFPLIAMPKIAQIFAMVFPYTFWLKIFISQTLKGAPILETMTNMYVFFIFMLITLLSFPRLKRIMQSDRFWNKI